MTTLITRKFEFDAGHRVLGHESKCAHLHGHRYVAEVTVTSSDLDKLGRVIDFSVMKSVIGKWIDDNWDHNMILHPEDQLLRLLKRADDAWKIDLEKPSTVVFNYKTPYIMPSGNTDLNGRTPFANPTAENMARVLFYTARQLMAPYDISVVQVKLWETPNCFAVFTEYDSVE